MPGSEEDLGWISGAYQPIPVVGQNGKKDRRTAEQARDHESNGTGVGFGRGRRSRNHYLRRLD